MAAIAFWRKLNAVQLKHDKTTSITNSLHLHDNRYLLNYFIHRVQQFDFLGSKYNWTESCVDATKVKKFKTDIYNNLQISVLNFCLLLLIINKPIKHICDPRRKITNISDNIWTIVSKQAAQKRMFNLGNLSTIHCNAAIKHHCTVTVWIAHGQKQKRCIIKKKS